MRPSISSLVVDRYTSSCTKGRGLRLRNTNIQQHLLQFHSSFDLYKPLLLTDLTGREVECHIKHVSLLPGAVGTQDVIWVFHGVHQNHHLMIEKNRDAVKMKNGGLLTSK